MNFALILVILSAITGVIYLLDIIFWQKKRKPKQKPSRLIEWSRSFFPVFFIVLLLRSFLIEPFRIPSGSLEPTLLIGDFLVVNKFIYGFRLPVIEKKIIPVSEPKTGDIVIFRWPPNPSFDYIKRVIGVPGDKVSYHDKVLTINGKEIKLTFKEYTTDPSSGYEVKRYRENLNGIEHDIFIRPSAPPINFDIKVPKNHYFVMGDNRDDSADSRFWGFVREDYLRGKAMMIWMSWDSLTASIRWHRLGQIIH